MYSCVCVACKSHIVLLPVSHVSQDGLAVILRSKNRDTGELMIFAHHWLTLLQAVFAFSHESISVETKGGY